MPFESNLANQMLFTPLDNKCSASREIHDKLTKEEFLNKCYSFPVFTKEFQDEQTQYVESNDIIDEVFVLSQERKNEYNNRQIRSYEHFVQWLEVFNNNNNSKIYTISGNAGTGKTTFLNHLKQEYSTDVSNNLEIIILDVSEKSDLIDWFNDNDTVITNPESAEKKVYGAVLNLINNIIFNFSSEDTNSIDKIENLLCEILKEYDKNYRNRGIRGQKLFEDIHDIIDKNVRAIENITKVSKIFSEHFTEIDKKANAYTYALDFLLILLRCYYKNPKKCFVIIFDNLERFIDNHEIYSRDLTKIRDSLRNYQNFINAPKNHNFRFKFIMAIRCNSARMTGARTHDEDVLPNDVDITQWYDIANIISKKESWYESHDIEIPHYSLYNQIINDERITHDKKITGLKKFIEPLFNYNKRLIMDFIGEIEENNYNSNTLSLYKKYWNDGKATSISKFAARSLIKETIIRKLATCDNMFDYFLLYKDNDMEMKNDYARQILTILYNKYYTEDDETIALSEILSKMAINKRHMHEAEYYDALENISSILYHMNSYNRRNNDWIQFIDLQFHNDKNESVFISSKAELLKLIKNDDNLSNFKLVIMDAGIVYLQHIYPSYEFLSVMHCNDAKNVFALLPTKEDLNNSKVEDLSVYKAISTIYQKAEKRIQFLREHHLQNTKMFPSKNDRNGVDCIIRIIDVHTSYLSRLIDFMKETYNSITDLNTKKLEELYESIDIVKGKYLALKFKNKE